MGHRLEIELRIPFAPVFYPTTTTNTELAYTYDTANIVSVDEYDVLHAVAAGTFRLKS